MILDASVVVKWILDEPGSDEARLVLSQVANPAAPAHVLNETGRALLRAIRADVIGVDAAKRSLLGVRGALDLIPLEHLVEDALDIALTGSATIYDALYVAAAVQRDCVLITADRRLIAGLAKTRLRGRAVLLGDWAAISSEGG